MSTNNEAMIRHILDWVSGIGYIKPEDIPNIDLYMDQVTTFMDAQLASTKRYKEDKILTKTMINNYTKNNLPYHTGSKIQNPKPFLSYVLHM